MTELRLVMKLVLIAFILSLLSPEVIHVWQWDDISQVMKPVFPNAIIEPHVQFVRNQSDSPIENCIELTDHQLTARRCIEGFNDIVWQSPESWQVTEAFQADVDRDGNEEIALVVWRPFSLWPIDRFLPQGGRIADFHDDDGMSAHLILIGWDGDGYRELWAGSALANPISNIRAVDIDGDGFEELIALESNYNTTNSSGNITLWRWQGFGFTLVDRIEGNFSNYSTYTKDDQTLILSD